MTNWVSCGLLVLAVSLTSTLVQATMAPNSASFAGLETERLRLIPRESCKSDFARVDLDASRIRAGSLMPPKAPSTGIMSMFNWTPDGSMDKGAWEQCTPQVLESLIQQNASSAANQAKALRSFFAQCDQHLSRNAPSSLFQMLWLAGSKYELCDNPNTRRFVAKLDDGKVLRGFLALKPGSLKRPLVIVRCGLFCNSGDITQRVMTMHLFDESPFHVLLVNGVTGNEYVRDNGHLALGGLDEGTQALQLARIVKNSKISENVSSIHYVGVSLGGQSALYASYMAPYNTAVEGEAPVIASSMAICPVVDLEHSFKGLWTRPTVGSAMLDMLGEQVANVISAIPALGSRLFPEVAGSGSRASPEMMTRAIVRHYASRTAGWGAKPFDGVNIRSEADLWRANKFTSIASQPLKIPTLVIAADDDMMVPTSINAQALQAKLAAGGNAGVVRTKTGNHCGFDLAYGWPTMSTIYRSFILSHSPEFNQAKKKKTARFGGTVASLWEGDRFHTTTYEFRAGDAMLYAKHRIVSGSGIAFQSEVCGDTNLALASDACVRKATSEIPLARIAGRPSWARVPRTEAEAQAFTRWANVNLTMVGADGKSIAGRSTIGAGFRWTSFE